MFWRIIRTVEGIWGAGSLDEASVIAMVRAGSADAFAQVMEHYQVPIFRYLYRMTGDYDIAQDLTQDTFVQAYKALLKTQSDLRLKAWLYRIATNNAFQQHRRKKLLSFIPLDEWRKSDASQVNRPESAGIEAGVQEALTKVPAEQRTCIVLHFVEGLKYAEIAQTLGISEEAVKKRVSRGKQLFRRLYTGGDVR